MVRKDFDFDSMADDLVFLGEIRYVMFQLFICHGISLQVKCICFYFFMKNIYDLLDLGFFIYFLYPIDCTTYISIVIISPRYNLEKSSKLKAVAETKE
jgi:hypothetical protein